MNCRVQFGFRLNSANAADERMRLRQTTQFANQLMSEFLTHKSALRFRFLLSHLLKIEHKVLYCTQFEHGLRKAGVGHDCQSPDIRDRLAK